LKTGTNLYLWR